RRCKLQISCLAGRGKSIAFKSRAGTQPVGTCAARHRRDPSRHSSSKLKFPSTHNVYIDACGSAELVAQEWLHYMPRGVALRSLEVAHHQGVSTQMPSWTMAFRQPCQPWTDDVVQALFCWAFEHLTGN